MKNFLLALLLTCLAFPALAEEKEAVFERVTKSGTLRCGYIVLPPEFSKDVNTGAYSGVVYDIVEEIGKRLHLKIDWTEEVNFQTAVAGLQAGRFDAVCFSLYRYSQAAAAADFSIPLFYSGTGVFVRADDNRFDKDLSRINSADATISTVDGEMSQFIAADDYPKAKTLSMPQLTDLTQMMKNVETGKADVAFVNGLVADGYLKANPGKLKNIAAAGPIRLFSHGLMLPKKQYDFVRMIDLTLAEMQDQGFINKILDKYDPDGKNYLRVNKPYEEKR